MDHLPFYFGKTLSNIISKFFLVFFFSFSWFQFETAAFSKVQNPTPENLPLIFEFKPIWASTVHRIRSDPPLSSLRMEDFTKRNDFNVRRLSLIDVCSEDDSLILNSSLADSLHHQSSGSLAPSIFFRFFISMIFTKQMVSGFCFQNQLKKV